MKVLFNRLYVSHGKRLIDILLCFILLFLLSGPILLIMILIYLLMGKPILFKQERPGKNERIFMIYKFRTMTDAKDSNGKLLEDEDRLTTFGRFLRRTSLDELPQLFNVFKGDLSLIGPRPLLVEYLPLYNDFQRRRHNIRPGITGWAQINGRNSLSWDERFEMDNWYVDHISFLLDIKILFITLKKVIKSSDISSETSVTMEKYTGNIKLTD